MNTLRPELYRAEWRSEFIETGNRILKSDEVEAAMKASGWAKEYCILANGFWLFGSLKALEKFEESLD